MSKKLCARSGLRPRSRGDVQHAGLPGAHPINRKVERLGADLVLPSAGEGRLFIVSSSRSESTGATPVRTCAYLCRARASKKLHRGPAECEKAFLKSRKGRSCGVVCNKASAAFCSEESTPGCSRSRPGCRPSRKNSGRGRRTWPCATARERQTQRRVAAQLPVPAGIHPTHAAAASSARKEAFKLRVPRLCRHSTGR